jgi:hypothetical protein
MKGVPSCIGGLSCSADYGCPFSERCSKETFREFEALQKKSSVLDTVVEFHRREKFRIAVAKMFAWEKRVGKEKV